MADPADSAPDLAPSPRFLTTRWTLVLAAARPGTPGADLALEELCRSYWFPLYAFVRRRGYSKEDAEDLVQGFFLNLLKRNYLEHLSSEKGRFRAFLLASVKHFLANDWDRAGRQKRGGHGATLTLDWTTADTRYQAEGSDELSPDKLYDRTWAIAVLERVLTRLAQEAASEGKATLFEQLRPFLTVASAAIPYREAAAQVNLTESTLRVAVHRLRRRYRELLREEVAQTLSNPDQVEEELRALFAAFAG